MIFHHTIFTSLRINDRYVLISYVSRNDRKNEVDQSTNHIARHTNLRRKYFNAKGKNTDTSQAKHSLSLPESGSCTNDLPSGFFGHSTKTKKHSAKSFFVECFIFDARQKSFFAECFFDTRKRLLCRVFF